MNQEFKYCIRCKKNSIMTLPSKPGYDYIARICLGGCDYKYYKSPTRIQMVEPWWKK